MYIGDIVIASGTLSYLGPFTAEYRTRIADGWVQVPRCRCCPIFTATCWASGKKSRAVAKFGTNSCCRSTYLLAHSRQSVFMLRQKRVFQHQNARDNGSL